MLFRPLLPVLSSWSLGNIITVVFLFRQHFKLTHDLMNIIKWRVGCRHRRVQLSISHNHWCLQTIQSYAILSRILRLCCLPLKLSCCRWMFQFSLHGAYILSLFSQILRMIFLITLTVLRISSSLFISIYWYADFRSLYVYLLQGAGVHAHLRVLVLIRVIGLLAPELQIGDLLKTTRRVV